MNSVAYRLEKCVERHAPPSAVTAPALIGQCGEMQRIIRLIERVGPTEASVFLTGESGSGKAMAARAIHDRSPRRTGPFVVVDCGALPGNLIEIELFGRDAGSVGANNLHVANVLNVANDLQVGAFERAVGGTLLLDDVTELPMDVQTRLLRVLESRKIYRVGAGTEYSTDVRMIAATNRCPLTAVKHGMLREDLLYRLAVFPIELPPLRSRGEDMDLLADAFLAELNARAGTDKTLSASGRMTLREHAWPGNVRELKHCIERAFLLDDVSLDLAPLLSPSGHASASNRSSSGVARLDIRVGSRIHDMERSLIEATLDYFEGNKRRAAHALGCSLKTLYNKLNGYSHSQECANT